MTTGKHFSSGFQTHGSMWVKQTHVNTLTNPLPQIFSVFLLKKPDYSQITVKCFILMMMTIWSASFCKAEFHMILWPPVTQPMMWFLNVNSAPHLRIFQLCSPVCTMNESIRYFLTNCIIKVNKMYHRVAFPKSSHKKTEKVVIKTYLLPELPLKQPINFLL